jgi:glutamate synthase (NADPH/NADH) large chain
MTGGVVLILGEVGRNFAAGMSGGIAYVYDPDQRLAGQCNSAGIDLEPVRFEPRDPAEPALPTSEALDVHDSGMGDVLRFDSERVRILLERHLEATGSPRARAVLDAWPAAAGNFVKVVPREYRRALLDRQVLAERHLVAAE